MRNMIHRLRGYFSWLLALLRRGDAFVLHGVERGAPYIQKGFAFLRFAFLPQKTYVLSSRAIQVLWGVYWAACIIVILWIVRDVQAPGTVVAIHAKRFVDGVHQSAVVYAILGAVLYPLLFFVRYTSAQMRLIVRGSIVVLCVVACIALWSHPTRSQDAYWNLLLAKGYTEYQMNPYQTTPNMLVRDSWSASVYTWRAQTMSHGIAWVFPLMMITLITSNLLTAIVLLKLMLIAACIALGYVLWKLVHERYDEMTARRMWILGMLQPVWVQYILIDMHNDVLVALSIAYAVWWMYTERYAWSVIALLGGVAVKYVPALIIIIPLVMAVRMYPTAKQYVQAFRVPIILALFLLAFFFAVQYAPRESQGLAIEILERGKTEFLLLGSQIIYAFVGQSQLWLRIVGGVLALYTLYIYVRRKKYLEAVVFPYIVLLCCGTPWFQSWYALWILPVSLLVCDAWAIALVSALLMMMHEIVMPAQAHTVGLLVLGIAVVCAVARKWRMRVAL